MNSIQALKWSTFTLYVFGGGLTGVFAFLAIINPKNSVMWIGLGSAVIGIAGAISKLWPAPTQSFVNNAVEVTPGGARTGATVATQPTPVVNSNH